MSSSDSFSTSLHWRGGRGSTRGRGRGRPYRRRGDSGNVERDGDCVMGDARHEQTDTRFRPYGNGRDRKYAQNPTSSDTLHSHTISRNFRDSSTTSQPGCTVIISNLNPDEKNELLSELKKSLPIQVIKEYFKGPQFFLTVQSPNLAAQLASVSSLLFKGQQLPIKKAGRSPADFQPHVGPGFGFRTTKENHSHDATLNHEVLVAFLSEKYDRENKLLDLSSLYQCRILQQNNIKGDLNHRNFANAVLDVISTHCPEVNSINFNNNRIRTLSNLRNLPAKAPHVVNLSFEKNLISHFNELDHLKDLKDLREIILETNPISHPRQNDPATYQSEVRRRFPNLQYIDRKELAPAIQFDIGTTSQTCPTSQGSYFELPEIQNVVVSFLQTYFTLYDQNRNDLVHAYSDDALASITVSGSGDLSGSSHNPRNSSLKTYYPVSRNLKRISDLHKRASLLISGKQNIMAHLNSLPRTSHIADSMIVETWLIKPNLLCAFIHGTVNDFVDAGKPSLQRLFDRCLILVPSLPGSPASSQGLSALIVNDQLHLTSVPDTIVSPNQSEAIDLPGAFSPQSSQKATVLKLSRASGMTLDFSQQCLENNHWNYDQALHNFLQLKSQNVIPPEAFL